MMLEEKPVGVSKGHSFTNFILEFSPEPTTNLTPQCLFVALLMVHTLVMLAGNPKGQQLPEGFYRICTRMRAVMERLSREGLAQ